MAVDFGSDGAGKILVHVASGLVGLNASDEGRIGLEYRVRFLVLSDVLGFKIGVCEETRTDGAEASVRGWKENASNIDDIARVQLAGERAMAVDGESARDVAHGDLVRNFLDFDFLERKEFGSSCRSEEGTFRVVLGAFRRRADLHGRELFGGDGLEDFTTTSVAGISLNTEGWLDV